MTATPTAQDVHTHLAPGEVLFADTPQWVTTILGSCVSVTMFAPTHGLAAICHAMLPHPRSAQAESPSGNRRRFVCHALEEMLDHFRGRGVQPGAIEVKVFGGANVIARAHGHHAALWVGASNVAAAREFIEREGLIVRAKNIGGLCGRKILFHTGTGEVLHKHLVRFPRPLVA